MTNLIATVRKVITKPFESHVEAVNCHHNYVQQERHFGEDVFVTRKGAVSAKKGQMGIIPGSMGARSFIVRGLGNPESFDSCSHGAGRVMSATLDGSIRDGRHVMAVRIPSLGPRHSSMNMTFPRRAGTSSAGSSFHRTTRGPVAPPPSSTPPSATTRRRSG